jgi:hypothetical protein
MTPLKDQRAEQCTAPRTHLMRLPPFGRGGRVFGARLWFGLWLALGPLDSWSLRAQTSQVPPFRVLSIALRDQIASVSINSATGCVYILQISDDLQNYWNEVTNQPGNGSVLNLDGPKGEHRVFYRVAGLPANRLTLFPFSPRLNSGVISLPDAMVGNAYARDITPGSTGKGPYDLQVSGSLPDDISATVVSNGTANAGLRLNSSGTNLLAGQRRQFAVSVTDAAGTNYSQPYDLRVIPPSPGVVATQFTVKSGAAANLFLTATNGTQPLAWTLVYGDLPEGLSFSTAGVITGTPTANASELNEDGLYTNVFQVADSFTDRVTGETHPRISCATITTLVRLSYRLNLILNRPNGPALAGTCIGCHGPEFPPDFSSGSALSVMYVQAGTGGSCSATFTYVTPGDSFGSLLYEKITGPPCGATMPQGGPYLNYLQTDRVARWINELTGADTD